MSSTPNARFGGHVWPLLLRLGLVSHAVEKQKSWKGEKDLCRSEIRTRVKQSTLHVSPEHKRRQNQGPWFSAHPQTGREARTDSGEAQFLVFNDKQVASPLAKKVKKKAHVHVKEGHAWRIRPPEGTWVEGDGLLTAPGLPAAHLRFPILTVALAAIWNTSLHYSFHSQQPAAMGFPGCRMPDSKPASLHRACNDNACHKSSTHPWPVAVA